MQIEDFIKTRSYLIWHVKDFKSLSESAILESVLNYGDFSDVKEIVEILGTKKAARLFYKQLRQKRTNYPPKISNYFKLYFSKHQKNA